MAKQTRPNEADGMSASEPVAEEARGTGPILSTPFGAATRGYILHALENKKARNVLRALHQ
jgi:hypothetical protein